MSVQLMFALARNLIHATCAARVKGEGFFETYKTTLGVDFEIKRMKVNGENVRLQIWDIMGQERFQEVVRAYYQNTRGVFIVYDLTSKESFSAVLEWKKEVSIGGNCLGSYSPPTPTHFLSLPPVLLTLGRSTPRCGSRMGALCRLSC